MLVRKTVTILLINKPFLLFFLLLGAARVVAFTRLPNSTIFSARESAECYVSSHLFEESRSHKTDLLAKSAVFPDQIAKSIIQSEMKRHPLAWQIDGQQQPKWNYTQGLELKGMLQWAGTLGLHEELLHYAETYTDTLIRENGSIVRYRVSDYKLDGINSGKLLFELYQQTSKRKYRLALDTLRQQLANSPRVTEGGFWHKRIYPHQMWLDGLYMGMPFYAEYAACYEEGERRDASFRDIVNQFATCFSHTWCDECRLLHHGWDEACKQRWADPGTGRSPHAWGRAIGWYMMALVDVMEWLPTDYQAPLLEQLRVLSASLLQRQRPNGTWQQVLDCPDAEGNYEEMSVTPMVAYAMLKGYRMGWLDRHCCEAGCRAVETICAQYVSAEFNGSAVYPFDGSSSYRDLSDENLLSLRTICGVAGLSDDRDGSLAYYLGEKIVGNDSKGIGPLLLALWEYPARYNSVRSGNAYDLLHVITCANVRNRRPGSERYTIHLPAGVYDLGERVLTSIEGHNIALVGQGMDSTIIRNAPPVSCEGISTTATLLNRSKGLRLTDLTLENALDYYSSGHAGRAVCLQDKGDSTVCQRVRMLSHQDTYYSNNPHAHHLFDECEIHGTVDYICGDGDIVFHRCTLVNEPRYSLQSSANDFGVKRSVGTCTITAPKTVEGRDGYLFWQCRISSPSSRFNLGRAWGNRPQCIWVSTTLDEPEQLLRERFSPRGMNVHVADFLECDTRDSKGNSITPTSNLLTITRGEEKDTRERILPKSQVKRFKRRVKQRLKLR